MFPIHFQNDTEDLCQGVVFSNKLSWVLLLVSRCVRFVNIFVNSNSVSNEGLQLEETLSLGSLPGFRFPCNPPSLCYPLQPLAGSSKCFGKVQEPFERILANLWVHKARKSCGSREPKQLRLSFVLAQICVCSKPSELKVNQCQCL